MALDGLDLDALVAPIEGESHTGSDIREDFSASAPYFLLRDARSDARAAERAADSPDPDDNRTNLDSRINTGWRNVRSLSVTILGRQSKDLEVAAWLTESLVRTDGFAGLAAGAKLIEGLASQYWGQLFPRPDEDGIVTLLSPVTGLNGQSSDGTIIQPLMKAKLFHGPDGGPIALFQYERSAELATKTDEGVIESYLKAGVLPFDSMEAAARAAAASLPALRAQVREAAAAWSAMAATFDRLAGPDSPSTARVAGILDRVETLIARYSTVEEAAAAPAIGVAEPAAATAAPAAAGPPRRLATREDALKQLAEIADFFRRNEPQSPLAYTIDDAIRRGRLTWPELIAEIVRDDQVRQGILTSLGIKAE